MYKNILIATDGSELANKAVKEGLALAKALNAPVKIVSVTEPLSDSEIAARIDDIENYKIWIEESVLEDSAQKMLSSAASIAKDMGLTCETIHVPAKHPADGIIETAENNECDLIIMASHGRRGVKKILLGSVANEVIVHSTVPVLIFR